MSKSKQKLSREKIKFNQVKPSIGKMIPPKTQRELQSFNACSQLGGEQYSCDISALGKSELASKKSLKMIRQQHLNHDFRESKTPRDHVPKLNAWEYVKEKNAEQVTELLDCEEEHNESCIKPSFDKEKYMKNNCINNRTKLQLDQVQNKESKFFHGFMKV